MTKYLSITIRWLDNRYHGQTVDGEPEWPPSPLRLFQALLATAYRKCGETDSFLSSLKWLQDERLAAPLIVAPRAQSGQPFTRFVPNNDSDKVLDRQGRLAAKTVRPTVLLDDSPIHYLWELSEPVSAGDEAHTNRLCELARGLVAYGWGVDMAVGTGSVISKGRATALKGELWHPTPYRGGRRWRIPGRRTLDSLQERHRQFIERLQNSDRLRTGCLTDVEPLGDDAYRIVSYHRTTDPPFRPFAAFVILKLDGDAPRAFDTARHTKSVAGMVRCASKAAAKRAGWPDKKIAAFIHGHTPDGQPIRGETEERRLAYLPLPSLEHRGENGDRVGTIRRVLIVGPPDAASEIAFFRRTLSGQPLIEEGKSEPVAILSGIRDTDRDWHVQRYTAPAAAWSTVTPVLLPGFDDGKQKKAGRLLLEAFSQAGLPSELVRHAEIEFRKVGFRPGVELASRYEPPRKLKHWPRYHVRVRWLDAKGCEVRVLGPIAVGAGRHRGFGVFAAESG